MSAADTIRDALSSELSDAYDCTRVWSAWGYGTMGEDDFKPVSDRLGEITQTIIAAVAHTSLAADDLLEALREIAASDSPLGRNGVPSHREIARAAIARATGAA